VFLGRPLDQVIAVMEAIRTMGNNQIVRKKVSSNFPNLQKAVETNIPLISTVLLALEGGLFAAVAAADVSFLKTDPIKVILISGWWNFYDFEVLRGVPRKYWVMLFSFIAGAFFYLAVENCIHSQLRDSDENAKDERDRYAYNALKRYNVGLRIAFLPFLLFLPPEVITLGFLVFFVLLLFDLVTERS
jgi:hypothetical protein